MHRLVDKLWGRITRDTTLTLQIRLYRLICLTVAIVSLAVVLPMNVVQHLPLLVNISDVVAGLFAYYCFRASRRGKNHFLLFLIVLVVMMDPVWFLNGGSQGSISLYFFPMLIYPMVIFRGRTCWIVVLGLLANLCALMVLEYLYPSLSVPFQEPFDRLLDILTSICAVGLLLALIMWAIITNYDWERDRIARYSRELAVSEKNYREVVENAKSIILRLNRQGQVTFFNKYAEDLFGFSRDEIIGKLVLGTIMPKTSLKGEDLGSWLSQLLQKPEQFPQTEIENACQDGRRIRVNWSHQPIYDEQNRLFEILCVGLDVTEHAALVERLQLTQKTMDAAAEQILWTDDQARIIYANTAAIEALGYSAEELRGLTLPEISGELAAAAWETRWQRLKQDRHLIFEDAQRSKDGKLHPVELAVTYLKIGGREYSTAFVRDITERKKAEEKRLQMDQQMQHMQKLESLGVLAGGIAHDFNNLLTAIVGNVSLVKMATRSGTDEYEWLDEAEKISLQARGLTAQLLTFSKGGKPVRSLIALEPVMRECASLALRGTSVRSDIQIAGDLWPVEADSVQIAQVLNNLLINAHQAMPNGGQVAVAAGNHLLGAGEDPLLKEGRYVRITVEDHGSGISEKDLPRIFEPYFTTKETGTGLGLAVVYSIIKNHHGHISVQSKLGVGTVFTILLPASERPLAAQAVAETAPSSRTRRILVMDDEEVVRKILDRVLRKLGYAVQCVGDGEAALQAYQEAAGQAQSFDLVIMDLTIPGGVGGKEAIRRLLQFDPQAKAIVSSGYSDDPVMGQYKAYGFQAVVSKPYTMEQLKSALSQVLDA
jgi:two-component system, cell cycle sensor histidine kinase and response regulator CckA